DTVADLIGRGAVRRVVVLIHRPFGVVHHAAPVLAAATVRHDVKYLREEHGVTGAVLHAHQGLLAIIVEDPKGDDARDCVRHGADAGIGSITPLDVARGETAGADV